MHDTLAPAPASVRPRRTGSRAADAIGSFLGRARAPRRSALDVWTWAVPGALAVVVGFVVWSTQVEELRWTQWHGLTGRVVDVQWGQTSHYVTLAWLAGFSVVAATAVSRWRPGLAAFLVVWPFASILLTDTFVWGWWLAALFVAMVLTFDATRTRWQAAAVAVGVVVLVAVWYCVSGASALLPVGLVTAGTEHDMVGLYLTLYLGCVAVVIGAAGLTGPMYRSQAHARAKIAEAEAAALEAFELESVTSERARVARDLHDVVAHHVSLVAVRAESAPYVHPELGATARDVLGSIATDARDALDELRQVLTILQRAGHDDAPRLPQPGSVDVASLVADARAAGQDVELVAPVPVLPAAQGYVVFRAVQEALTNARRHAPGKPARVEVEIRSGVVGLRVTNPVDDAADVAPEAGRGLLGMRERAEALGGAADHAVDDGTFVVCVSLPLPGEGEVQR
jgi:signal transduction histidine kinase